MLRRPAGFRGERAGTPSDVGYVNGPRLKPQAVVVDGPEYYAARKDRGTEILAGEVPGSGDATAPWLTLHASKIWLKREAFDRLQRIRRSAV